MASSHNLIYQTTDHQAHTVYGSDKRQLLAKAKELLTDHTVAAVAVYDKQGHEIFYQKKGVTK